MDEFEVFDVKPFVSRLLGIHFFQFDTFALMFYLPLKFVWLFLMPIVFTLLWSSN